MGKKATDIFCQRLSTNITFGTSADTASYQAFTTAYKPEDLVGFILHRVEYHFEASVFAQLDAAADRYKFGLSFLITQPSGGFESNDPGILDHHSVELGLDGGTEVELYFERSPVVTDWTGLPGGGILVHPVNLFAFGYNDQVVSAGIPMHAMIFYTNVELTPALHQELFQSIYIRQV